MKNTKSRKGRDNYRNKREARNEERVPDTRKNDASWYTRNSALVADSGRIAFTWPTGTPVSLDIPNSASLSQHVNGLDGDEINFPGVMRLSYVPTYGMDQNGYDPLNIAAQNVYTYVRHVQSGHSNYDPSDLMLYLMAMDQIYALYMHLVRAYGTVRLFSQKNRNFPKVVLNAMGFDYADISRNLADFRYFINNAATRIGAMVVPNNMPIFARHMWMPAGIYTDGPSAKAQMYIFRPQAFGVYNEKGASTGGYLSAKWMAYVHTVKEWCDLLDSMISAVRNSEDCGIMSGDVLKAYGDNVIKLPFISEDYMTNVLYSPEVLGQIANATVMPDAMYQNVEGISDTPMIYQDLGDNVLKSGLIFTAPRDDANHITKSTYEIYSGKRIMAGLSEQPTPEEVMVNSRLMVVANKIENHSSNMIYIYPDSVGSEVVVEAAMFSTEGKEGYWNDAGRSMHARFYPKYAQNVNIYVWGLSSMAFANYFNLHPSFSVVTETTTDVLYDTFFDVDNFAIVDSHDIAKMHDTALLSMLDVPLLGSAK